jgi:hypothetical protein
MSDQEMARASLTKQRRFLILMSLALVAYYTLGISVDTTAEYNGLALKLANPRNAIVGLWLVWGWAVWRYWQRSYALLSVLKNELVASAQAEAWRIISVYAARAARVRLECGNIPQIPRDATIIGQVENWATPPNNGELPAGTGWQPWSGYFPLSRLWRRVLEAKITFGWHEPHGWYTRPAHVKFRVPKWHARWITVRAWLYSMLHLPAATEHIAPVVLAGLAVWVAIAHQSTIAGMTWCLGREGIVVAR